MKKISAHTTIFALTLVLTFSVAGADVICSWNVADSGKNANELDVDYYVNGITAGSVTASGVHLRNGKASEGQFSAKHWTICNSASENDYYEFTVTMDAVDDGTITSLDSLIAPLARETSVLGLIHGAETWDLMASYDGFSTAGILADSASIANTGDTQVSAVSFNLSNMTIASGQSLTFRLYGYNSLFWNSYAGLYAGDTLETSTLSLQGSLDQVPEPATASILLVGMAALMMRARSKQV